LPHLLVFVDTFVESSEMDNVVAALSKLENLVDLYEVTGEFDIVTLISADDMEEFRRVLGNGIEKIKGVRSTVSSVVLSAQGVKVRVMLSLSSRCSSFAPGGHGYQ
jgi:DNA-binding Lrp family transcriptional regulator